MTKERITPAGSSGTPHRLSGAQRLEVLLGFGYLYLSLATGVFYLYMLAPSMQNDLWWAHYNTTGHQSFLADIANIALTTTAQGALDVFGPAAITRKQYDASVAYTSVYPTYVNQVILTECVSVPYAVGNLRNLSAAWSTRMMTQYCWVDFEKRWEVAHTPERQRRCETQYASNGAVYLESVLRNLVWDDFMAMWGGAGNKFTITIQNGLVALPGGQAWLDATASARATTSIDDEIARWSTFHLSYFQLQWGNKRGPGVTETMLLQNALGMQQQFQLKNTPLLNGPWTSMIMYWRFLNDIFVFQKPPRSLVRQAPAFFGANSSLYGAAIDLEVYQGLCPTPGRCVNQISVFRSTVGPFISVDIFYVAPPPTIAIAIAAFQCDLALASSTVQTAYANLSITSTRPVPPAWTPGYAFYGGNPMCTNNAVRSFVQQSFDYSDACGTPKPLLITHTPDALLFCLVASQDRTSTATCASQNVTQAACVASIEAARAVVTQLPSLSATTTTAMAAIAPSVSPLGVSLMQYAKEVTSGNWVLLQHELLSDPTWSVFGYLFLLDWANGKREVLSFQGDVASLVLISNEYAPTTLATPSNELKQATKVFYYLCVYTSVLLLLVASLCTFYGALSGFHLVGRNLFRFNRVVGSVWIGRPLLLVRGGTAMLLLSTAQVSLMATSQGTRFASTPRTLVETIVVAGEATWITYVLNDILLLVVPRLSAYYAPISSCALWLLYIVLDATSPVELSATLHRVCSSTDVDYFLSCTSGVVEVGSTDRITLLLWLQLLVVGLALGMTALALHVRRISHEDRSDTTPFLISSATNAFFTTMGDTNVWAIDRVSCIMAGLVPFTLHRKHFTFDLKSWLVVKDTVSVYQSGKTTTVNETTPLKSTTPSGSLLLLSANSPLERHSWDRPLALAGLVYMTATIVGSLSYLSVSQVNLANDLWWANFNSTGAHAFLANWYNEQLYLNASYASLALDTRNISATLLYGAPDVFVTTAANFGSHLQHTQLNTLPAIIAGLRSMDACTHAPWIFTQYCFLDFQQMWPMANSARRQQRCARMTTNGAVYLESLLRNVHWDDWQPCWGFAFQIAFANDLQTSLDGQRWLHQMQAENPLSIVDEATYWRTFGVVTYDVQWQNFKQVGLLSSYNVLSAYSTTAALTLQALNGSYQFSAQTTFKAYWALANDLAAVSTNSSGIGGLSLLRASARFAFANTSLAAVLVTNMTISTPFGAGFSFVRSVLGPFGSMDMRYVRAPASAQRLLLHVFSALRSSALSSNQSQSAYMSIYVPGSMYPVPQPWLSAKLLSYGGSPLCPELGSSSGLALTTGLVNLLSYSARCSSSTGAQAKLTPSREQVVFALLLSGITPASPITAICAADTSGYKACPDYLRGARSYLDTYLPSIDWAPEVAAAIAATTALDISLLQLTRTNKTSPLTWSQLPLFNPSDANFAFFAWCYVAEWLQGFREVVAFDGDVGSITLLTDQLLPLQQGVAPWEIPTTMATYARTGAMYVTLVVLSVAILACVYILASRGHVEGMNMLELSRVGGIVWVGRPLLFLRSLTAMAVLCTGSLDLQVAGSMSYLHSTDVPWYKTCLAASEVSWLVAIVNDVLMIWTKEHTALYVTPNGLLVTGTTALLSMVSPVTHTASLGRACDIAQVDFQIVCTGGDVVIGVRSRVALLVLLVGVLNVATFGFMRWLVRKPPKNHAESLLLYAGAKYLFLSAKWIYKDVYCLDRASAALNGLVSVRYNGSYYGLDIKTWRTFTLTQPSVPAIPSAHALFTPAMYALPLDNLSAIDQAIKKSQLVHVKSKATSGTSRDAT
ncbi:hypothetical protein SDRG_05116 [Saprolegnia diclina VS20]|uniref:Uncharacterized protein n=1 Tax=Saprolegnia diclina (strain VS20) TaxID=1156394 RepID=T0RY97_SAPDV|nr:hypothetical protein SDRG_05116 [Saprolegnia diclina VS20]EQC37513.1 hypothetical protein SDRG_05116 [Saprolegnia diclina VS20]|eukprot:XP_008609033.1 hypothetical protein SDRG_05116 [Saprolegnia diclina VS20]